MEDGLQLVRLMLHIALVIQMLILLVSSGLPFFLESPKYAHISSLCHQINIFESQAFSVASTSRISTFDLLVMETGISSRNLITAHIFRL